MKAGILAATVWAAALFATGGASAMSVTYPLSSPVEAAIPAQKATIYCGPLGCGPIWPGPRHWAPAWGPWGPSYRPACPLDYYYACRRGPLGYRQCACWPYPGR
jgi:hypothetical protein